VMLHND